jgi:hypothetical protein
MDARGARNSCGVAQDMGPGERGKNESETAENVGDLRCHPDIAPRRPQKSEAMATKI